jgi:hypothetical protein
MPLSVQDFDAYMRDALVRIGRKIDDLEDVRMVMDALHEVSDYESATSIIRRLSSSLQVSSRDTHASSVWTLDWCFFVDTIAPQIREKGAHIDAIIIPIEEIYALLARYDVRVPKDEMSMVSDMRYMWKRVDRSATDTTANLSKLQVHIDFIGNITTPNIFIVMHRYYLLHIPTAQDAFKRSLLGGAASFKKESLGFRSTISAPSTIYSVQRLDDSTQSFITVQYLLSRKDWQQSGPMVPDLDPMDAIARLHKFKQLFEVSLCKSRRSRCKAGPLQHVCVLLVFTVAPTFWHIFLGSQTEMGHLFQWRSTFWFATNCLSGAGANSRGDGPLGSPL